MNCELGKTGLRTISRRQKVTKNQSAVIPAINHSANHISSGVRSIGQNDYFQRGADTFNFSAAELCAVQMLVR